MLVTDLTGSLTREPRGVVVPDLPDDQSPQGTPTVEQLIGVLMGEGQAPPVDVLFESVRSIGVRLDEQERLAARAVYRQLAGGAPATAAGVADAAGWDCARAARFLDELPRAERDDQRRVVGFGGLTLRQTPHRVVIGEAVRHAWCAWDTLFLPIVLDATVEVTSACPATDVTISLTVAPDGVVDRHPATAVLSFVEPDGTDDVRDSFCALVHLFADRQAAADWTGQVPGTFVLDLDDAFELGRRCMLHRYGTSDGERGP